MAYYELSREQLLNLPFSLEKEIVQTSLCSAYSCTSVIGCNTRKYHGLFIVPQNLIDHENHVLLSSLDETVLYNGHQFCLGVHQYSGGYTSKGYEFLEAFQYGSLSTHVYRLGSIVLRKEHCFLYKENRLIIRYSAEGIGGNEELTIQLSPFLAFRQNHKLTRANTVADASCKKVENGGSYCLYPNYTPIFIQASKKVSYENQPDWHYNIEYFKERERGYESQEDLLLPGYFETSIKSNESVFISVGLEEINPYMLSQAFYSEVKRSPSMNSMEEALKVATKSFLVKQEDRVEVIAGFPWFGRWGRDTFISLPGLLLSVGDVTTYKYVLESMMAEQEGALFPNIGYESQAAYNSVDAPLWFFWALQKYADHISGKELLWKKYAEKMKAVLEGYRDGTLYSIRMLENGLIYAGEEGKALTWMDAIVEGVPVTPRVGLPVEINALWYNAIQFCLELAGIAKDKTFVREWAPIAEQVSTSFKEVFWDKEIGWLADVVNAGERDFTVRPNMIFAVSLPYTCLSSKIQQLIVDKVKKELLTPFGLRSLSPEDIRYQEIYWGTQNERDAAYHQGTVWPWLIGHFCEAYFKIYGPSAYPFIEKIYVGFERLINQIGIGTLPEICDGAIPHQARGSVSQAWSVAEVLRVKSLLELYSLRSTEEVTI